MNAFAAILGQVAYDAVKHLLFGELAPGHDTDQPVVDCDTSEIVASLRRIEMMLQESNRLARALTPTPSAPRTGW